MNAPELLDPEDTQEVANVAAYTPPALPALTSVHPMALIARAVDAGRDIAFIEKLMDLQDRNERKEARRAYNAAVAQFRASPPKIVKDKQVGFEGKNGKAGTSYRHATLGQVAEKLGDALAPYGLSLRWDVAQPGGGIVRVTCHLCHVDGHSESCVLEGPYDDSGNKNRIQQVASTVTYLKRHTCLAVTGVAVSDDPEDNDGAGGATAAEWEKREQTVEPVRETRQQEVAATDAPASSEPTAEKSNDPMIRLVAGRMERTGKTEADLRAQFGHGFEGLNVSNVNAVLDWARK